MSTSFRQRKVLPNSPLHWCLLYRTEEQRHATVIPFIRDGLTQNEKVLYLIDSHNQEAITNALQNDGVKVDSFQQRGQLVFVTLEQSYLQEPVFNPDHMIGRLHTEAGNALRAGYTGLRVTGEMTWALRGPHETALIAYETKLNQYFPIKCIGLCQYDRRRFSQTLLLVLAPLHSSIIINDRTYHDIAYTTLERVLRS